MRLIPFLVSSLLAVGSLAAKKNAASVDKFQSFLTKAHVQNPIKLDDSSYRRLTSAPRDYSIAVLLTAMDPRYGCTLCREFQPEWDLLAKSWLKGDRKGESRLIYATLDFNDGKDTFMSLSLQTAPVLFFLPATSGPHAAASSEPIRYDFNSGSAQVAEAVHTWLSRHLPDRPHPPVRRPINWMRWISGTVILLGSSTVSWLAWPYVVPVITSRNIWAGITLISILVFTSGHMFNHIRKVPYVTGDGRGGISYFAGGFQSQYGLETQIVAAMYGVLAFAAISLAVKVPRIADAKMQQVAVIIWSGVLLLMYSFLLSVFRVKNSGYPFSLPPFF